MLVNPSWISLNKREMANPSFPFVGAKVNEMNENEENKNRGSASGLQATWQNSVFRVYRFLLSSRFLRSSS